MNLVELPDQIFFAELRVRLPEVKSVDGDNRGSSPPAIVTWSFVDKIAGPGKIIAVTFVLAVTFNPTDYQSFGIVESFGYQHRYHELRAYYETNLFLYAAPI